MKANDKIFVRDYLKDLNERVKFAISFEGLNADYVNMLTCKKLASNCEVTPATISNLTTSSSFFLLYRIAEEILDAYYGYFMYEEAQAKKMNPDEIISPRDKNFVLMFLTNYYTGEFLRG